MTFVLLHIFENRNEQFFLWNWYSRKITTFLHKITTLHFFFFSVKKIPNFLLQKFQLFFFFFEIRDSCFFRSNQTLLSVCCSYHRKTHMTSVQSEARGAPGGPPEQTDVNGAPACYGLGGPGCEQRWWGDIHWMWQKSVPG